ncbi:ribose 5-phosphate isomerase B [Candidatus Desantisbacteria bacterium CG07_land_8_20_14_0_80_39_15]|uniref:Ribose 5-phosphate isomerase B n=2 Tax=unclassified Candidatus Desantisiibacteriota TaxID=3106372 RepID=A0A2H9PB91_9BACT|nr:MAG: ribose 5-phosphate isomerase B [Candidatus Desantisbacteria bacterium CG07_land_8_20_14_0_80_39_15]PIZ16015.1 MAG: ribose 5-phosphate isomerase B [Candidatus Desantisbacteria bacterium CG_4_10_14_0_8_um_filter_39_17]
MEIAIGNDHAGFKIKNIIKKYFEEKGISYKDFGSNNQNSVDYPDYALPVALAVSRGEYDRGILICGTGIGMSLVANKVWGIRGAVCHNVWTARVSRAHNDANVLLLGGRVLKNKEALKIVRVWLKTKAEGGRHRRRVKKIKQIERRLKCMR